MLKVYFYILYVSIDDDAKFILKNNNLEKSFDILFNEKDLKTIVISLQILITLHIYHDCSKYHNLYILLNKKYTNKKTGNDLKKQIERCLIAFTNNSIIF